jgi:ABC-type branched-subunit amino acid transport system substrate-binding protein
MMLDFVRRRLWLQLSLSLAASLAGVVGASYTLAIEGRVSVHEAFLLCLALSVMAGVVVLRSGLDSLRMLADTALEMSVGQPVTIKSTSRSDVGRLAKALRVMQAATQAAMSRMDGADRSSATGTWPVMVIGGPPPNESKFRRAAIFFGSFALLVTYAALTVFMLTARPKESLTTRAPAIEAPHRAAAAPTPTTQLVTIRGVTKDLITVGDSSPFSGGPRSLSEGMKLGLDTAFAEVNAAGGVHGRQLKLVALDNGYDEKRALDTTKELVEKRDVFALVGNVGTPTVKAVLPYVNANKVLLFGPLTGSPVTRNDPPDRYVFNVRASYERETSAMVEYLLKPDGKHIPARSIVVFAQTDSFGDAGYTGANNTVRRKVPGAGSLLRVGYDRNTADVADAAARVLAYNASTAKSGGVQAVIVVATATASASFTAKIASIGATILNVSFVDASQLALEFHDHWPGVGTGVIVTQVVPHPESGATGVIRYREALKAFAPDKSPGFASLEGYVVGELFVEGLRRAGPNLTTETLIDALEKLDVDLGTGGALSFGISKHDASQKVYGTVLTANGTFKPLDSEWTQ